MEATVPQLKVFNVVPGAWEGKARLRIEGNLISEDGSRSVGTVTFYQREGHPLPTVNEGQTYELRLRCYVSKGRIEAGVDALVPVAKAA